MGVSKFEWTDGGAQTLTLQQKVQDVLPGFFRRSFEAVSLDGTVREVVTAGSILHEITCSIRMDTQADAINKFIDAGLRGISLTFTPDTDTPATTYTVQLMAAGPITLEMNGRLQVYAVRMLRLRRLDGGDFSAMFP